MIDESFEPQPIKRKRSSILSIRPRDSLTNLRNSRTVSFNERCIYRELHQDGTCDVTDLLLREDMELTALEIVDSEANASDCSFNVSMQISTVENEQQPQQQQQQQHQQVLLQQHQQHQHQQQQQQSAVEMDLTLMSQFKNSMSKSNNYEVFNNNNSTFISNSSVYEKRMSLASDISSLNSTLEESSQTKTTFCSSSISSANTTLKPVSMISDLSCNTQIGNDTLFDAFQDTLDQSIGSFVSGADTLMHNIEALDDCMKDADRIIDGGLKKLNKEITQLLRFHRHVMKDENEFAIKILGVNYPIWIIFYINPENYPDEEVKIRFGVKKCDLNLYPWATFHAAVKRVTRRGEDFYLMRLTRNIKLFVRFLKRYT